MKNKWAWKYIKEAKVYNPEEVWPGFYYIYDKQDNTIAHIELPSSGACDEAISGICLRYNYLQEELEIFLS